jgi:hypothetical protein
VVLLAVHPPDEEPFLVAQRPELQGAAEQPVSPEAALQASRMARQSCPSSAPVRSDEPVAELVVLQPVRRELPGEELLPLAVQLQGALLLPVERLQEERQPAAELRPDAPQALLSGSWPLRRQPLPQQAAGSACGREPPARLQSSLSGSFFR